MSERRHDGRNRQRANCTVTPEFLQAVFLKKNRFQVPVLELLLLAFFMLIHVGNLQAQCNPAGNPTRYEFNVDPTTMLNIAGQQFCTSQSMGTNCCGMQPSYRCLDLVFNLEDGPMGEMFSSNCNGLINLMTANGNFDALYFDIGVPDPVGNSTNCAAPIMIGNNHVISVEFTGNAMGQIEVELSVIDNMGMTIFNAMEIAMSGQAVILTICKPGFGCVEDEVIFGCCDADATMTLALGAPATICEGGSSALHVKGLNGTPPYTLTVKAASASDTTYIPMVIPDDMDGNTMMDTTTVIVSPTETTTYSVVSVEDVAGCVQPVMGQMVTITVNPIPTVDPVGDQTVCNGSSTDTVTFSGSVPGTVFNWTNNNTSIGLAASGSGNIPAFTATNAGTTVQVATITVTPLFTQNDVTCPGSPIMFTITVNPTPTVNPVASQTVCNGSSTAAVNFSGSVPGTVFDWTNNNTSIGLAASGSGDIPAFTATNAGTSVQVATIIVTPSFTQNGVNCPGTPIAFTITVNPTPTVNPVASQTLCSGTATAPVTFSGNVPGTVFNWTNTNTDIGLAASGSGNIPAFIAQNPGNTVLVATIEVTPGFTFNGVTCTGTPISFTITVYPRATVFAGTDQTICQNQQANLAATLGGGATSGTWSGGAGVFSNPFSAVTTYTPDPAEYGTSFELVFTTNDPAGPCTAASDTLVVTVNTLPLVYAGKDILVCMNENLDLSKLGATFDPNGSGATGATWSTSGTGVFQPNNAFATATTYIPSMADRMAGFVSLTLSSTDPPGPCTAVSDQAILFFYDPDGLVCNDDVMIALDEDGIVCITPDMILEGDVVDSMYTVEILVNGVSIGDKVNCAYLNQKLQVRVRSICTGVFCIGSILVKDNLPPKLTCTNIELICAITNTDPAYLQQVLGIPNAYPLVEENCSVYTLTHTDYWNDLTCDDDYVGYVYRVWTATDPSGNKGTCVQYINFLHQHVTDVKFPSDTTLYCDEGPINTTPQATGAPYLTAYGMNFPIYPDAGYCKLSAIFTDNRIPLCDGSYDIIRIWTVYDACLPTTPTPPSSNPKYYTQIIKVRDLTGPEFSCPDDLTVSTDPLNCCGTVNLPDVVVSDVCSRIKTAFARVEELHQITGDVLATYDVPGTITTFPGNNLNDPDTLVVFGFTPCLPLGTHRVTYIVEDDCGNTTTCSFDLTIEDGTPPVPACDEITQVALGIDGMIFVNATTFDDGSYDNCSDMVYFKARRLEANTCQPDTLFYDQVKFCCEDINDTILVILRVYDVLVPPGPVSLDFEEINSNDCQVQVYVEDKLKPSCIPPANTTVSCENFDPSLWAYGSASGLDNCCVDTILVNDNYLQFDTLCNKGTITRTFRVVDCGGLSSTCTQRIIVNYEQDYFIRFPNDWIVTVCDGTGNWGQPEFYGEDCELIGVSFKDEIFTVVPDACFKIERTWTIINWCTFDPNQPCIVVPNPNPNSTSHHPSNLVGPTVSAPGTPAPWAPTVVKIAPTDPQPTNFSTFWSANANCYKYKQIIKVADGEKPVINCPDNTVQVCDLTTNNPQLWNQPYWFDLATGKHDLCEAPTDLCITASDACSNTNISFRYLLFLDLDNNGTMETVVSSTNPPDPGTVLFGNAGNPNYTGGTSQIFDGRPVSASEKYRFALQTTVSGGSVTACLRWNTQLNPNGYVLPELPYGTHKIKWFVLDGCGNEAICEYTFVVKDCKAPTVTCLNGLSVNIMPTGMISINTADFVQDAYDNCTPPDLLIFGIRRSGTGTGFPFNPDGTPQTSLIFTCDDVGFILVDVWVMDLAGNADFCQTYIQVQDNSGVCGAVNANVAGMFQTETGLGVEDVQVQLQGAAPGAPPFSLYANSDSDGQFVLANALPMHANAVLTPLKDNDPLNGVSTYDLVLINKHILGLQPLNTPYKMIAADANNSRSITTFDILEFRKLILGLYTELPNNTSWRFIDKGYVFPNPDNPFQAVFPEIKELSDIQDHQLAEDFVAVKTGDVNGNAVTNSLLYVDERIDGLLLFDVHPGPELPYRPDDQQIEAGDVFSLHFMPSEPISGYQFTLYFPELELLGVDPGAGMQDANFAAFPDENALTASFHTGTDEQSAGAFALRFRARRGGQLSQLLNLSSQITRAEAYRYQKGESLEAAERLELGLRFQAGATEMISGIGFELYQNQPNPWTSSTRIGFHLPEASEATFTVYDEIGRTVYTRTGNFVRGYNNITLDNSLLDSSSGMFYYKLETDDASVVKRMIRIR